MAPKCTPAFGNNPTYSHSTVVHCILSRALKACLWPLTIKQMIPLRTECQRMMHLQDVNPTSRPVATTQIQQKNAAEDSRAEAGSNTTALNFDHISQAERLIKGEKLLRARQQALQF